VVLIALLVAADRVALLVAERAAAKTLQSSQHLDRAPSVSIAGFPFLTQLAAGHFDKVTLAASDLTVGRAGRTVRISKVTVDLHGAHAARDLSSVHADTASATAAISYSDLSATLGVPLAYGVGRITARKSVSIAGQQFSAAVAAEARIVDGSLRFVSPQVSVDGVGGAAVPQPVIDLLSSVFGDPIALTHLPFGLTVRSVTADARAVRITLAGRNLTFRRS
jgi:LmeA-like phospholipid-binding